MTTAKKWFRLAWYAGFFLLACYASSKYTGWQYVLWLGIGGCFYHKASEAFKEL